MTTSRDAAPTIARLALAVTMFPHGAQKTLGWFGGYGWSGTMAFFTDTIGLPGPLAAGVILVELIGPLLLLIGLATRPVALALAGVMVGAIATVHAPHGFFMNWSGTQAGEGLEYHLLVIGLAASLAVAGGGRWSLDRRLTVPGEGRA
ncbi:MAG: DoxX family protein [Planctomycetota bacterium]